MTGPRDPGSVSHGAWLLLMHQLRELRERERGGARQVVRLQLGRFVVGCMGSDPTRVYIARDSGPGEGEAGIFKLAELEAVLDRFMAERF